MSFSSPYNLLAAYDEIPDEALEQFIDKAEDFFENYVTPCVQLQTLSQLQSNMEEYTNTSVKLQSGINK